MLLGQPLDIFLLGRLYSLATEIRFLTTFFLVFLAGMGDGGGVTDLFIKTIDISKFLAKSKK